MVILEAHVPIWGHSCSNYILYIYNLVGGLEHFLFFHILGIIHKLFQKFWLRGPSGGRACAI